MVISGLQMLLSAPVFQDEKQGGGPSMASETKPERRTVSVGKQFYAITKGERGRASFIE